MADNQQEYGLPALYSRRQRDHAGAPDVFQYEQASPRLRVQTTQILNEAIGPPTDRYGRELAAKEVYEVLVNLMRRELGVHQLIYAHEKQDEFFKWLEQADFENWLDAVEAAFKLVDGYIRDHRAEFTVSANITVPDKAIHEFNARCRESGLGFYFSSGDMIRVDSQVLHVEAVLPALRLLADERFKAANEEYREAHQAFKLGNFKDCIVGCGRSFESVLKVIGSARCWQFTSNDPASKLIAAAAAHGFLPSHLQTSLNHLRGLIESSVPTIRNKSGGHGAGGVPADINEELAAFQLHQTAAVIVFLVEHDKRLT